MMLEEVIEIQEETEKEMPSFNHSYICTEIISQILQNSNHKPLVELTLDIENGITPDISVFPQNQIKPNFLRDIPKFKEMPILAIEIISASQNIQTLLEKAQTLVKNGVHTVWTVEPFGNTIFVTTNDSEIRLHNQEIETEGIKVDFRKIFSVN